MRANLEGGLERVSGVGKRGGGDGDGDFWLAVYMCMCM